MYSIIDTLKSKMEKIIRKLKGNLKIMSEGSDDRWDKGYDSGYEACIKDLEEELKSEEKNKK